MEMEYRRLGRAGLEGQRAVVRLVGDLRTPAGRQPGRGLPGRGLRRRGQLLRQRRGLLGRRVGADHGRGHRRPRAGRATATCSPPSCSGASTTSVNMRNTLNRKYLMQAIDGSLERLGLDFVDLVYCHRPDPETPIEETVWAMSDMIVAGQGPLLGHLGVVGRAAPRGVGHRRAPPPAQAGGGAAPVQPAVAGPGRAGVRPALRRHRARTDHLEPAQLGPAHRQVPRRRARRLAGPRCPATSGWPSMLTDPERNEKVRGLAGVAEELDCTLAQLAIAWCAKNPHVSTVITGASRVEQVHENLGALDVLPKLTDDVHGPHRQDHPLRRARPGALRSSGRPPGSARRRLGDGCRRRRQAPPSGGRSRSADAGQVEHRRLTCRAT